MHADNSRTPQVFGASDPNSGTASLHEVIKGFGELLKQGWKPLRTIVFASWDAEEYGLVGSTEFGEDYAEHASKVVAYINLDAATAGSYLSIHASPSLADMLRNVTVVGHAPRVLNDEELSIPPLGSGVSTSLLVSHTVDIDAIASTERLHSLLTTSRYRIFGHVLSRHQDRPSLPVSIGGEAKDSEY